MASIMTVSSRPSFLAPPKTAATVRSIPLPTVVVDALAAHLAQYPPAGDGLVFVTDAGNPIRLLDSVICGEPRSGSRRIGRYFHEARFARNRRLGDALFLQAFAALNNSPGARAFYDRQRTREPPTTRHSEPLRTGSSASSTATCEATPLRRTPRLAQRTRQTQPCSLTASGRGMSSQVLIGGRVGR